MTDFDAQGPFTRPERPLRIVREPRFSGLDFAAFAVTFVMVCMPLALGAFGL